MEWRRIGRDRNVDRPVRPARTSARGYQPADVFRLRWALGNELGTHPTCYLAIDAVVLSMRTNRLDKRRYHQRHTGISCL